MDFYSVRPEAGFEPKLQQGDILLGIPFHALVAAEARLVPPDGSDVLSSDLTDPTSPTTGDVVVKYRKRPGVVMSQSCDLERGDRPIILAPIYSYIEMNPLATIGSEAFKRKWGEAANPGRQPVIFPLPPFQDESFPIPYSYILLLEMQSFVSTNRASFEDLVRLRLVPDALGKLQERLAFLFGRFAAPDGLFLAEEHRQT
jgi:hypothetical protein